MRNVSPRVRLCKMRLNQRFIFSICLTLFLSCSLAISAQEALNVNGVVNDEKGEPLVGVTVSISGENKGTFTDIDGKYAINNVSPNATLKFSFTGFETAEINVAGRTSIEVKLKEETTALNEVVVIGYGAVKKKDLTGAIASVDGAKIAARQNTQVTSALQGAISGVTVTRSSSAPGTAGSIRIRGITSMRDEGPLIIIDGVPANSINDVNADDIENLTVLKDASSASIYGARAAAGVVLITTKRGRASSGANIDYNYSYSADYASDMPDYADAVTYMRAVNEREWNGGGAVSGVNEYSIYEKDVIDNYWQLHKQNPDMYPNTDWTGLILKNFAPRQSHQLGITLGGEKYKTKASFGYDDVDGLFKDNLSWTRAAVRVNNDIEITKWLSTSIDLNLRKTTAINPAFSPSYQMRYSPPVYAAVFSDGRMGPGKEGANPYGKMMEGGTNSTRKYLANGKFSFELTPLNGLSVTGVFAPTFNFSKEKDFIKQAKYYVSWDSEDTRYMNGAETTKLTETRNESHSYTYQAFANYIKDFNHHNFNLMAGYEEYYYFHEALNAGRSKYELPYYPYLDAGPQELMDNGGSAYENSYRSFFGRLMYNWKSRYFVQANIRRDGSSRFHADHRWGTFPSFSAGWLVTEEDFMKNVTFLTSLKLRGSWGQLGDERIGNYTYQSYLEFNNPTLYSGNEVKSPQGVGAVAMAIKDKTWETTTTMDVGFDLSVLNGRLRLSADYYKKDTKDMLIQVLIPVYLGYDQNPYQNIGKMNTRGWDLEIGWNDKIGDLNYGVSFNIYDSKSKMGYMKNTLKDDTDNWTLIREGDEYLTYYGYISEGIYQNGDELNAVTSKRVGAGDIRYKDISGPEGIPDGIINKDYDRVALGGSLPRYNYGGSINLDYKGIDFALAFQGVGEKNSIMTEEMTQPVRGDYYNVPQIIVGKYWSNYNTDAQNKSAMYPRIMRDANENNYVASDFWMFDGSYFRIKNITLGYTLPKKIVEKIHLKNVRIYTSLQDMFTISNYPKGWDPEVSSTGYPITKSVLFGISLKL